MRAIWSFWSKPYLEQRVGIWVNTLEHLLAWSLSVETARQHYSETALYTDDLGASVLVDRLGLRFDEVSTSLNCLEDADPGWWSMGKFYVYREQTRPFVHLDNDVFLWKPLPDDVAAAQVFAQHPEEVTFDQPYYQPAIIERALATVPGTWLPAEWTWYRQRREQQMAACCGILGGRNLDFLQHYANCAIRLLEHPCNRQAFATLADRVEHMVLVEQWFLCACLEYHRANAASQFGDVAPRYLFESWDEALNPMRTALLGFTHLIGTAKSDQAIARRLERRVARDYPDLYTRAVTLSSQVTLF